MGNTFFKFKHFTIHQEHCAMKVTTDGCLFGSIIARRAINLKPRRALDIGAGTGLLSLMLAQQNPAVHIDAIEIDTGAAMQAKENFASSPWPANLQCLHKDARMFKAEKSYDLVFSNPPFYANEWPSPDVLKNAAHHQTHLKPAELAQTISNNLEEEGVFFLLLPYKNMDIWHKLLQAASLEVQEILLLKQTSVHPSFFRMILVGQKTNPVTCKPHETILTIKNADHQYTAEFIQLLKDYYLYL